MATKYRGERRDRHPLQSLEVAAFDRLARTAEGLQASLGRLLRDRDLTPAQFAILRTLRDEGRPLPILELADRLVTAVPGITGLIDRLERAGLVERKRSDRDRRVVYVAITPEAEKRIAALAKPVEEWHEQSLGFMNRNELKDLLRLLEKIERQLGDDD